jgi:RimJ/RimL family protein N-acetyltransferase
MPSALPLPLLRPSARTLLRPLDLADATALFAAYGDDDVCTYWSRAAYASVDETARAVAWEIENGMSWAVVDAARGDACPLAGGGGA